MEGCRSLTEPPDPAVPTDAPTPPDREPEAAADIVEALLFFGRLLLASGDAVSDINVRLRSIATAWGAPGVQFIVLPDLMLVSVDPNKPAHMMSRDLAADHLRLDQVVRVMHLTRQAQRGVLQPSEAVSALHAVEDAAKRPRLASQVLGTVILTLGMALLFRPADSSIPLLIVLGAIVGLMQASSNYVKGLGAIMPVLIGFVVSLIAFKFSGHDARPIEALVPSLTIVLPGALLTTAAVDLASGDAVSGSSRFMEGMLRLALLAFGIFAAALLLDVHPSATREHGVGYAEWAPWLGVLIFAVGITIRESAPRGMLPWLLVVLYVAHGSQLVGDMLFGAVLSGFFGTLVAVPLVAHLERYDSAPPALALFLPAFLMLVPGALGLLGVSELVTTEPTNGMGGIVTALAAILSIALGVLVGLRLTRIFTAARTSLAVRPVGPLGKASESGIFRRSDR